MRYRVVNWYTGSILCNVPELRRAMDICKANTNTCVINSLDDVIYSNVTTF